MLQHYINIRKDKVGCNFTQRTPNPQTCLFTIIYPRIFILLVQNFEPCCFQKHLLCLIFIKCQGKNANTELKEEEKCKNPSIFINEIIYQQPENIIREILWGWGGEGAVTGSENLVCYKKKHGKKKGFVD